MLISMLLQKKILGEIGELSSGKVKAEKNKRTLFKSLGE